MKISDLEYLESFSNLKSASGGKGNKILLFRLKPDNLFISFEDQELFSGKLLEEPSELHFTIGNSGILKVAFQGGKVKDSGKWSSVSIVGFTPGKAFAVSSSITAR